MEITIAVVITAITYILGEITKLTNIPNKYIPLQNIVIAIISSIICIAFKIENLEPIQVIMTCIFSTMSAGGIADLGKVADTEEISKED